MFLDRRNVVMVVISYNLPGDVTREERDTEGVTLNLANIIPREVEQVVTSRESL